MEAAIQVQAVSVFGGPNAAGNPAGVVLLDTPLDSPSAQAVATRLGFPDTIFCWKERDRWHARFFSPREELSVCYHALLAAAEVLEASPIEFVLRDRALVVERSLERWWIRTPAEGIVARGTIDTPFGLGQVVDTGRARAFVQVSATSFESIGWPAARALERISPPSMSRRPDADVVVAAKTSWK